MTSSLGSWRSTAELLPLNCTIVTLSAPQSGTSGTRAASIRLIMAIVVHPSRIHAYGCYTTEPIQKAATVIEYTGPRLTVDEADTLYENSPRTYLFGLEDGKQVIDGDGLAAFINHSCDPNCEPDEINGRVFIFAIRDIKAGEELTYDYNLYDGELDDVAPCSCRSQNCRRSMYSETEIARRPKLKSRKRKLLR